MSIPNSSISPIKQQTRIYKAAKMKLLTHATLYLTIALAIVSSVMAKESEKKRTTYQVVYFQKSDGTYSSVTFDGPYLEDQSISVQAAIRDNSGVMRLLWATQGISTPVAFRRP